MAVCPFLNITASLAGFSWELPFWILFCFTAVMVMYVFLNNIVFDFICLWSRNRWNIWQLGGLFSFFALHSIFEPHLVPSFLSSSQTSSPDRLWDSCIYLLTRISVDRLFPPEFTVQTTTKSSPSNGKLYLKLFSNSVFKWPEKCLSLKFCTKKNFVWL